VCAVIRWRWGTVVQTRREWRGSLELDVTVEKRRAEDPDVVRALAYPALVGFPLPGDRVLLNLNALALGLGTGGYALVVALPDRLPDDVDVPGHVVKARYTPLQAVVLAADEEASPLRPALADATDLGGMPVVVADLHSALPAVVAGARADRPDLRIAYVMTDGGALPAWFSRTLSDLRPLLAGTVTTGQAFGGDLESTNVHSGLLAARHGLSADLAIVTQGPGNLGTGTSWGFSGVAAGEAVNAVAALGGHPIAAPRISDPPQPDRLRPGRPGPGRPGDAGRPGTGAGRHGTRGAGRPVPAAHAGGGPVGGPDGGAGRAAGEALDDGPRPGRGRGLLPVGGGSGPPRRFTRTRRPVTAAPRNESRRVPVPKTKSRALRATTFRTYTRPGEKSVMPAKRRREAPDITESPT
jgi:hypothetical protein